MKDFGKDTPMGRPGQPNEVAPSFLFLACEDSRYMSGQVLHPNGGTSSTARPSWARLYSCHSEARGTMRTFLGILLGA